MNKRKTLKPILTYSVPVTITMEDFEDIFVLKYYDETPISTEEAIDICLEDGIDCEIITSVWRKNRKEIIEAYDKWEKEYAI
jgi:hypothetical protein